MSLYAVAHLYRVRLRARFVLVQEAFAALGIAVGVALLFASQVATASLGGSVAQLTNGVIGESSFQVQGRSARGFPERLLGEVQALPGVRAAVPVLEAQIGLVGPKGRRAVYLLATEPRDVRFAGRLLRHLTPGQLAGERAIVLPAPLAGALGAGQLQVIEAEVGAHLVPTLLAAVLSASQIGPLVHSPVAVAPLRYAQSLTGMGGRLSRVFVQVRPGREAEVLRGLRRIAAGRLNVEPADFDATQFDEAAIPVNQSVTVFSAICALMGFMFAFCAVLLTAHLRRQLISELRLLGTPPRQIVKVLLFDAAALGVAGSLLGLALGDVLSVLVFSSSPEFLTIAFPIGSQRIITWQSVAVAVLAGLLAAAIGVLVPLRGMFGAGGPWGSGGGRRSEIELGSDGELGPGVERGPEGDRGSGGERGPGGERGRLRGGLGRLRGGPGRSGSLAGVARGVGLACLAVTTVIVLAAPAASLVAIVTLLLAALLLLPLLLDAGVAVFGRLQRQGGSPLAALAVVELSSRAARTRMLAIAATAAIAVIGGAMLEGSRSNLQAGLTDSFHRLSSAAQLWVSPATGNNLFATVPFHEIRLGPLRRLPGVRSVSAYRASFLNVGDRRVYVGSSPAGAPPPLTAVQLSEGSLALANARLRRRGWVVLSTALAAEYDVGIGQLITLPTVHPIALRVAALITDLGWPAGAVLVNPADYVAGWGSTEPTAYSVMLAPGASPAHVAAEVRRTLTGLGYTGLGVQTERRHEQLELASGHQGLERLTSMALLLLFAGVLASASTMGAAIWQRRRALARLKVQGLRRGQLWRSLLWESTVVLGLGCLVGVAFGVYGQLLVSRALRTVTGFPMVISLALPTALASFALVALAASAVVAIAGYRATAVPAQA